MTNPLIISILGYLREQNSSCSLIDLINLCEQDFLSLILKDIDPQIVIFQKNFLLSTHFIKFNMIFKPMGFY